MDIIPFDNGGRTESFPEIGGTETARQEDRKIIYIQSGELIRVGRALNEHGFVFVNYKTFTVEMWEQFEGCRESCAVGSSGSSYVSKNAMNSA